MEGTSEASAHERVIVQALEVLRAWTGQEAAARRASRDDVRRLTKELWDVALTVGEAAERLSVSRGTVRRCLIRQALHGTKTGGRWRLLRYQFTEAGALPGVAQLVPKLSLYQSIAVAPSTDTTELVDMLDVV